MNKAYAGKAIAGTSKVSDGFVILNERVVNHYSKTHTTSSPEFSELVGLEVVSYMSSKDISLCKISYQSVPK